ncbi:peptidase S8/S53 subtilisin kexin sedolisin [Ligilactobacillus animalis]|uniref:S8 family serine peptidase n=1 Tax=Ligilactobacillus animalis TaxID=1605 RepID=UPI001C0FACF4|nr:peptidase S8/S53 subtilisin kexin sedolisin [Ligilactobacillus animalis]
MKFFQKLSCVMLLLALVICFYYRNGLVSKPIGHTGEFTLKHEQAGYAVSLYYPKIDLTKAHQKNVSVGIIDSGISPKVGHELNIAAAYDLSGQNEPFDKTGQGTKIASIIGAKDNHYKMIGLAPNVKLYSYKVDTTSHALQATLQQALSNRVEVLDLSFKVDQITPQIKALVNKYLAQGGLFFTADKRLGQIRGAATVGTFNEYFELLDRGRTYYAPAEQLALGMDNRIQKVTGDAYSTAFVSGTAASLLAQKVAPAQVKQQLAVYFSPQAIEKHHNISHVIAKTFNKSDIYLGISLVILTLITAGLALMLAIRRRKNKYLLGVSINTLLLLILAYLLVPIQANDQTMKYWILGLLVIFTLFQLYFSWRLDMAKPFRLNRLFNLSYNIFLLVFSLWLIMFVMLGYAGSTHF